MDCFAEEQRKKSNACIWSIYNAQAEKLDNELAVRWIGQSRSTLHFVGLLFLFCFAT